MTEILDDKPETLQQKLDNLPTDPGVYKFLDADGSVLYVGKAKNLRARVRQYFRPGADARFFVAAGLLAVGFALLGLVEVLTIYSLPFKMALLLAHVFVLAVTLRALYRSVVPATGSEHGLERRLTQAAVIGVAVALLGLALVGRRPALLALVGLSALAFALSGFSYGRRGATEVKVQGTVVDTLLRHLLPVLLFAAIVPALDLAVLVGLDRVVVLHIQVVFVIMAATTLMTATIKLRQNVASL
jgi:hypothetical protein